MSPKTAEKHAEIDKLFAAAADDNPDKAFAAIPFDEVAGLESTGSRVAGAGTQQPVTTTQSRFGGLFAMSEPTTEEDDASLHAPQPAPSGLNSNVMSFFATAAAEPVKPAAAAATAAATAPPAVVRGAVTLDQIERQAAAGTASSSGGQPPGSKKKNRQQRRQHLQPAAPAPAEAPAAGALPIPASAFLSTPQQQLEAPHPQPQLVALTAAGATTPASSTAVPMSANAFFAMIQSTQPTGLQAARGSPPPAVSATAPSLKATTIDLATLFGGAAATPSKPVDLTVPGAPRAPDSPNTAKFNSSIADIFSR